MPSETVSPTIVSPLWKKLCEFAFDDPDADLPFSTRLARENGWSREFAACVVEEYRRYLFLCATAGHTVCPSDEVDQAWHLHLTYTNSYWDNLCGQTLGQPVHHGPTKGGPEEYRKHVAMYEQTLESYRRVFQSDPPADIWPASAERFGTGAAHRRVNLARNWVIPKPRWTNVPHRRGRRRVALMGAAAFPAMLALAGPWDWRGPDFLKLYVWLIIGVFVFRVVWKYVLSIEMAADDQAELDPYEVACLSFDRKVAVNAAVAKLAQEGRLVVQSGTERKNGAVTGVKHLIYARGEPDPAAPPLERAICVIADDGETLSDLQELAAAETEKICDRLRDRGLLVSQARALWIRLLPVLLMTGLFGFGVVKIAIGVERNRPIGFLILLSTLTAGLICYLVFASKPYRTTAGSRLVRRLKHENSALQNSLSRSTITPNDVALAAGLFGLAAMSSSSQADVYEAWKATTPVPGGGSFWNSGSSAGCGGGCGAGCGVGCGGGCGGCGG